MPSATPTPSPRPNWFGGPPTPRRPATRAAHGRVHSYSQQSSFSPHPPRDSPRYNSFGEYATVEVSPNSFPSSYKTRPAQHPCCAGPSPPTKQRKQQRERERRHSFTFVRTSTPYGESDEDEIIVAMGRTFVLPAKGPRRSPYSHHPPKDHLHVFDGSPETNHYRCQQDAAYHYPSPGCYSSREASYDSTPPHQPQARPPTGHAHARRSFTSLPPRPSTVRPTTNSSSRTKTPAPAKATEADARQHKIPPGYSIKYWDPKEEPILLLGSVFDANSLGKWIYDWTVYREGPATPIADMAGELWLLLIQFSGRLGRAENTVGRIRSLEKRDLVDEYVDGGERIMDKLRSLLKSCEAPMLRAARKKQSSLGKNSGVEFVDTLFGRDRELPKTEKFMQMLRLFNLRFDANCEEILQDPTR